MKKQAELVRKLMEEYFYLMQIGDLGHDDYFDREDAEKGFNHFLRWLGASKPVGRGLGWNILPTKCIGKRRLPKAEVKRQAKILMESMENSA